MNLSKPESIRSILCKEDKIVPRSLRFSLAKDSPKHWNDDCPIKTHLFNAIALLAPGFERLAISSVLPYKDKIQSAKLREQILGFIGQESAHGSEFLRYNLVLKAQGYDTKRLEKGNLKKFKGLTKRLSAKMHLSLTLAAEHLTAIISDLILRDPQWLQNAHLTFRALWRWHAIEEIEHKAVVFDLYQSIGGGYFARIVGMCLVSGLLGGLLIRNFFHLAKRDNLLFKLSFWLKCCSVLWGKPGFLRKLFFPYFQYYSPHFHPWLQDNYALIAQWKMFFASTSVENMVQQLKREGLKLN